MSTPQRCFKVQLEEWKLVTLMTGKRIKTPEKQKSQTGSQIVDGIRKISH